MEKGKILNLGCGTWKMKGVVNVDSSPLVSPDKIWDLNKFPYPWEDCSIDKIIMKHVLEHLDNVIDVMNECDRILKWGGILEIAVPHCSHDLALGDKHHKNIINVYTFSTGSTRSGEDLAYQSKNSLVMSEHSIFLAPKMAWLLHMPKFIRQFCADYLRNIARESIFVLKKIGKFVTLTFDDGPSPFTLDLLNQLKIYNIKAAFFVLGVNVLKYPEITRRIVDEGHDLGIHGFNHSKWVNKIVVQREVSKTRKALEEVIPGYKIEYFRVPYLRGFADKFPEILRIPALKGLCAVDYSTICEDWLERTTIMGMIDASVKLLGKGGTILLHDGYRPGAEYKVRDKVAPVITPLLAELFKKNYKVVGLKELENHGRKN